MNIGVLGTGNMGIGNGKLWAQQGQSVRFGYRDDVVLLAAPAAQKTAAELISGIGFEPVNADQAMKLSRRSPGPRSEQ